MALTGGSRQYLGFPRHLDAVGSEYEYDTFSTHGARSRSLKALAESNLRLAEPANRATHRTVKLANVVGTVVSTINHELFDAHRLLVCELEGSPGYLIAVDVVDAGIGDRVLLLDEGTGARQILGRASGPVRTVVVAIVDTVSP